MRDRDFAGAQGKFMVSAVTGVIGAWLIAQELWFNARSVSTGFLATGIVLAAVSLVLAVLVVGSAARFKEIVIERTASGARYRARTRSLWRGATETERVEAVECRVHEVHLAGLQVLGVSTSWDGYAATVYCGDVFVTTATRQRAEEIDEHIRALPEPLRSEHWQRGASITCPL